MARKKNTNLKMEDSERWLVLSDPHYPFQHKKYLDAIKNFAGDFDPHTVVLNGDGIDFYDLSRFDKDPGRRFKLQEQVDEFTFDFLEYFRRNKIGKKFHYLEGNHEYRLKKYLWTQAPALSSMRGMSVENFLNIKKTGWNWHTIDQPIEAGKLLIHHGLFARKGGGMSAKAMLERYGQSILSGHSHRMGSFFRSDYRGVHAAWEQGCLLDRSLQEYDPQPDWQNGFAVVHVWPKLGGYFHVDLIPLISNQWFLYGEKAYQL